MSQKDMGASEDGQDAEPPRAPSDSEPLGPGVDLESYLRSAPSVDRFLTETDGAPLPESNVLDTEADLGATSADSPVGLSPDDVAALLDGDLDAIAPGEAESDPGIEALADEAFREAMREGESIQSVFAETADADPGHAPQANAPEINVALGPDDEDERSLEEILANIQDKALEETLDLGDPLPNLSTKLDAVPDAPAAPEPDAPESEAPELAAPELAAPEDDAPGQEDGQSRDGLDQAETDQPDRTAPRPQISKRPIRIVKRPVIRATPLSRQKRAPKAGAEIHMQEAARQEQSDDLDAAIRNYQHVVRLAPERHDAWARLGVLLQRTGKPDPAIVCLRRAIALSPEDGAHWSDLGNALRVANRLEEAHRAQDRALELAPGDAQIHHHAGLIARDLGDTDAALHAFRRAELLGGETPALGWDNALTRLLEGQLRPGFEALEARWSLPGIARRYADIPQWTGEDLAGKSLLLHAEDDLSDTLQFSRYAPRIQALGAQVRFEVQPALRRLFAESEGFKDIDIVERQEDAPTPEVDLQLPLLSAPARFNFGAGEAEALSPRMPYLNPPASGPRLAVRQDQPSLRVGLAWSADPRHDHGRNRSTGLAGFTPLLDTPGASFFGLQVGPGSAQIQNLGLEALIDDVSPSITDFRDAAAMLRDIDLLISVDSPIAHLAGALNKEVWTAIPFAPDWRWRLRRKDSPWYPSMTLFRQTSPGDWDDVFARLRSALIRRIGN